MSKADEMFKTVGYEKYGESEFLTEFRKRNGMQVVFLNIPKRIVISNEIELQELQAINEKCKELGWL